MGASLNAVNHGNPSSMSIRTVTRTVQDPSGYVPITLKVIDAGAIRNKMPSPVTVLCPVLGTIRSFEAYTPNSTKNHRVWKAFQHFKSERVFSHGVSRGVTITADLGDSNNLLDLGQCYDDRIFNRGISSYTSTGWFNSGLTPWYVPTPDDGFIPLPSNLELLKVQAVRAMLPKVKAELSSLVSLYEAKDILSIRGSIKRATSLSKAILAKFGGATRAIGKSRMTRTAADSYLQWMFNVKPLISDIGGIYHAIARFKSRVNDLISRSGTLQEAHFKCDLKELLIPYADSWSAWKAVGSALGEVLKGPIWKSCKTSFRTQRRYYTDTAVFRSCMQYNYSFTAFQLEHAYALGLLDALGVNFNPKYVWNVIPWSFLLDWFVDVSRWLDQFETKNLEPKVNILQYCWSVKKTRRIAIDVYSNASRYYGGGASYGTEYLSLPEIRETSYRRGIDFPTASSFTTSGLSPTQLSLGAALLLTRRRRNTKTRKSWNEKSFKGLTGLNWA